jgi:spermidine/putrescine transport system ATP-binding protein
MVKNNHKDPIVQLANVEKSFGAVKAVVGVSLNIYKGEFFSLLGPSGCGKTTLLRLIAGFEKPENGHIVIDGKEMALVEPNHRPTNMVFQNYAIFPHLNVEENVGYGLKRLKVNKADKLEMVNKILLLVGLEGLNMRSASALSGGQRQRVALARALILKPKVLLLDEPLSALDKKLREQMQVELRELQRAVGITFILVTHDQEEALTMSDQIAVMFDGSVEQLASPKELYDNPKSKRVASFIGNMNFLTVDIKSIYKTKVKVASNILGRLILSDKQFSSKPKIGPIELGIRPEMLTIKGKSNKNLKNSTEAKIKEVSFFGDYTQYKLRFLSDDVIFIVSEMHSQGTLDRAVGDFVVVSWDPDSFVGFV